MTKIEVTNGHLLNPRALAPRYTGPVKQMSCYNCAEPNATFELYELTRGAADDPEVLARFRARTDVCEPVLREIYRMAEQQRDAAQAAGNPLADGTRLVGRVAPPANRPERLNARRLPILGAAAEYLHDKLFYQKGQCVVTFLRRYESS